MKSLTSSKRTIRSIINIVLSQHSPTRVCSTIIRYLSTGKQSWSIWDPETEL